MSVMSKRSLASWRQTHGFGILNIIEPRGEHFFVEARVSEDPSDSPFDSWTAMSETQLRQFLAERGFSDAATDDAIELSRQWATTITNPSFFPKREP
jgi:hypothetical protein